MDTSDIEKRMKEYESRNQYYLQKRTPVIIRLDGRSFHTFTKGFVRPFDHVFMKTMQEVMKFWVVGRKKAIQNFVEKLSYRIGYKCDYAFTAGMAHIDVLRPGYECALKALSDVEFVKQFIVPYSQESYDNETYFEVI